VWLVDGYRDDTQRRQALARGKEMLARYVATLDPNDEPIGVERTVALKTDHAALFGRVDRIDDRPGEGLVIVDYKTGRQLLTVDDARTSMALAVYALGAQRTLRRPCRRVELHHLPTGQVLTWTHTEAGLARHLSRADSIAAEVAALDARFRQGVDADEADRLYPTTVGPMCAWCDYNRACPEGRAAVSPRDSWAGIEQPV
jgi:putative RecB family exonuclease